MKPGLLQPIRGSIHAPHFYVKPAQFDQRHIVWLKQYGRVELRPIRPSDEVRMIKFHETLSEESVYLRYFEHISLDTRTLHERLSVICANTADSFAIVAERHVPGYHPGSILGVGRLTTLDTPYIASFAMLVSDEAQKTDLPREMLKRLIILSCAFGFSQLEGELLMGDRDALALCREMNFNLQTVPEDGTVHVRYAL